MIKTNKALIVLVTGMGVIILMGLGALITGIAMKTRNPDFSIVDRDDTENHFTKYIGGASPETINISVPKGFQIKNVTSNTRHVTLHIKNDKGRDEVLIMDIQTEKMDFLEPVITSGFECVSFEHRRTYNTNKINH